MNGVRELSVFVERRQRFGENHVGPGFNVGRGAIKCGLLPLDACASVRAMMTNVSSMRPSDGCLDAIAHLSCLDQCLTRPVTATLDRNLILKMAAGAPAQVISRIVRQS